MSFGNDFKKFTNKTMKRATDFKRAAGIAVATGIILDTPVDTGRARGNWQITLTTPADSTTNATPAEALNQVSMPRNHGDLFDVVYLTNNLPYIEALEFGHSQQQAPYGMVRKNVKRVQQKINDNWMSVLR